MNIRKLASGVVGVVIAISAFPAMAEDMTLEQATAEVERLEQENLTLQQQLDANEEMIAEYKQKMASIEEQIAELQTQTDQ